MNYILIYNPKTETVFLMDRCPWLGGGSALAKYQSVTEINAEQGFYELACRRMKEEGVVEYIPMARFPISRTLLIYNEHKQQ